MDHAINWIWQGCLVAAMTMAVLRLMERTRAQARYVVCWLALAAITVLPVLSWGLSQTAPSSMQPADGAAAAPVLAVPAAWWTSTEAVALAAVLWFLLAAWRMTAAVGAARRARAECTPLGSDREPLLRCWNLVKAQGRQTTLMVSPAVRAASVLGGGRPIIAIAPALIERLTSDELDRIVIHEWAHVQRRDDLLSIAHAIVRALAGWHPAAWWLERRMLIEREIACDETAVRLTGCPKRYAACLTAIATLPAASLEAIEAVGVLSTPALTRRVVRILSRRRLASPALSAGAAAIAILVLSAFAVTAAGHRLARSSGSEPVRETASTAGAEGQARALDAADGPRPSSNPAPSDVRGATEDPQSDPGPIAPVAAERRGGREVTATQAPSAVEAATPATHLAAAASPGELSPPRLVPLAAAAPSVPVIDQRAMPAGPPTPGVSSTSPWAAVADAGAAVGHGSRQAGVATGRFFSRLGKQIAGSF